MKFLQNSTWHEVFEGWREREAHNPDWIRVAQEKGWPTWEAWRESTANHLKAPERTWAIFEIEQPLEEVPSFLVGPFPAWQKFAPLPLKTSFRELITTSEQEKFWLKNTKILQLLQALPFQTQLIGLRHTTSGKITCIEGHHRAMAMALAQKQGLPLNFSTTPLTIALSELPQNEENLLHELLTKGTCAP